MGPMSMHETEAVTRFYFSPLLAASWTLHTSCFAGVLHHAASAGLVFPVECLLSRGAPANVHIAYDYADLWPIWGLIRSAVCALKSPTPSVKAVSPAKSISLVDPCVRSGGAEYWEAMNGYCRQIRNEHEGTLAALKEHLGLVDDSLWTLTDTCELVK